MTTVRCIFFSMLTAYICAICGQNPAHSLTDKFAPLCILDASVMKFIRRSYYEPFHREEFISCRINDCAFNDPVRHELGLGKRD